MFGYSRSPLDAPEHEAAVAAVERVLGGEGALVNAIIASEVFHTISRLYGVGFACERVEGILDNRTRPVNPSGGDSNLAADWGR